MIDTIEQAMAFVYGTTWKGSVLGLERITELMRLAGDPQKKLKFVHIAGTNGKGSTAAILASVLAEAGLRTGLYTSPYIENFGELIQVNGVSVSDDELILLARELQKFSAQMADSPTEYEIITALALLHFSRTACDIVVLEVGMGGRLDSTNVISAPEAAIITAIGLDHMAQLGNTVEKIAGEKAGIIKKNCAVICHPQKESVAAVIRAKCAETGSSVVFVENGAISRLNSDFGGQSFAYRGENFFTPLLGEHQLRNAAVAIETVKLLRARGWEISENALADGLRKTVWRGRFEIMQKNPPFIVDVAHNPQGIQACIDTVLALRKQKIIFIFGVLADKNYTKMAKLLVPHAKKIFLVTPKSPRALPAAVLREKIAFEDVAVCDTISRGVKFALEFAEADDIICALGSLSMVGAIRGEFA